MKRLILLVSVLGLSFILTACGGSGEQKEPSKESQKSDKYEYEYYEVLNDGKEETPNVEIKYKDKNGNSHLERTDLKHVYEHILSDGNKKPYIVKDGSKVHVYRPPYMMNGDDDVEGKAVSKDEVSK
ncbi:lipoprotein [Staphylococcus caprae]|uniref:LptM family lipoprotein n=1 Tax=Staphylococcus caprae TaxID=29380 RepID=UPI003B20CA7D